jgi:hypothetical protein
MLHVNGRRGQFTHGESDPYFASFLPIALLDRQVLADLDYGKSDLVRAGKLGRDGLQQMESAYKRVVYLTISSDTLVVVTFILLCSPAALDGELPTG